MSKKKVVVIGGAGFLGSHIADCLSDNGYKVLIYDIQRPLYLQSDHQFIMGDIQNLPELEKALENAYCVYHLAGIADIDRAAATPRETVVQNINGSVNVFEACIKANVSKLLFASTVYVYSDKGSFYRVSKQAAELLLENYHQEYELNYTTLRYGSLYGPRSQEWNGLKKYVAQAIREKRIVYPGTGAEKREYIHVKDAALLSVQAIDEKYNNQCLTLTGTQVMTTQDVLVMIAEILNEDIKIDFVPSGSNFNLFHYQMTPYRYTPKSGYKMVSDCFIDLGQGILDMIEEVHQGKDLETQGY